MYDVSLVSIIILLVAGFFTGFVDSMVGGGGMIQLPALLNTLPHLPVTTALGTNKFGGMAGVSFAMVRYARKISLRASTVYSAALPAFVCAFFGAWLAHQVSSDVFRSLLPWILLCVAAYTFWKKDLGMQASEHHKPWFYFAIISGFVGVYDGFLGPGTGSFLLFAYVRIGGLDFLHASAYAKISNACSNLAACILFGSMGAIWWQMALALAVTNILGGWLGTHIALRYGNAWVRKIFLVVVVLLLLKMFASSWSLGI